MSDYGKTPAAAGGPASVFLATVIAADPVGYTVDVRPESTGKPQLTGLPMMTPYVAADGSGVNVLPDVGTTCLVLESADGSTAVLGCLAKPTPTSGLPGFSGGRPANELGDLIYTTKEGNFVKILRGGIVHLGASGLANRMYIPVANLIRDVFERFEALSPCGEIKWLHSEITGPTGNPDDVGAVLTYRVKEKATDSPADGKLFTVEVACGELSDRTLAIANRTQHKFFSLPGLTNQGFLSTDGVVSILVASPDGSKGVFTYQLSRLGDVLMKAEGLVHVEYNKLYVKIADSALIDLPGGARVSVSSAGALDITGPGGLAHVTVGADGAMEIGSSALTINIAGMKLLITNTGVTLLSDSGAPALDLSGLTVNMPGEGAPALLNVSGFLDLLLNHDHKETAGLGPSVSLGSFVQDSSMLQSSRALLR